MGNHYMSFIGFLSSPISIPPTFDTSPCLEHLTEYEDCVIDVGTDRKEYFMPSWPTLWPGITEGKSNIETSHWIKQPVLNDNHDVPNLADYTPLTENQKQLLYECEEERILTKACLRELIKLKRGPKHMSWETADAANMGFT
eukprot:NODE_6744_length_491_cov_47.266968_g5953_i0.p1 GENE.NODE_6744_length_491_cov_47.266968_g5953_i0~~NODE_6744_length_491_cov_47.266968_g5953_i0.p1  ORF type:complete len:157 (+),score=35.07 NODE_6744_length_491_cov_47.266968_g5953_i0:47-472(+)